MNGTCHELFAHSRLAEDENGTIGFGHPLDLRDDFAERVAPPDEFGKRTGPPVIFVEQVDVPRVSVPHDDTSNLTAATLLGSALCRPSRVRIGYILRESAIGEALSHAKRCGQALTLVARRTKPLRRVHGISHFLT
jgi:hypothetical protein